MTSGQKRFPVAPSMFKFKQHGKHGAWISELLPHTASIADDIAIIRSVHTEAINHDPARTLIQTGAQARRSAVSMGTWVYVWTGQRVNANMPAFMVLTSYGKLVKSQSRNQALYESPVGSAVFMPVAPRKASSCSTDPKAIPILYRLQSGRRQPIGPGNAERWTRWPSSTENDRPPRWAIPRSSNADRAIRDGVSHAGVGSRADST